MAGDTSSASERTEADKRLVCSLMILIAAEDGILERVERKAVIRQTARFLETSKEEAEALVTRVEAEPPADGASALARRAGDLLPMERRRLLLEILWDISMADEQIEVSEIGAVSDIADALGIEGPESQALRRAALARRQE